MKATSSRARVLAVLLACVLALVGAGTALPVAALAEEGAYSAAEPPSITSPRALMVELETDTTLFERDADERCYPASITKVMTAIVVLENADLDAEVTVEESDFDELTWDSSVADLKAGETLSVRDLLACLLLPSGNDAAYVLARYVGGGDWHAFVDLMNEKAAELGCENTHFVNPCGLHDDDHYTTARDLVTIFEEALSLPDFVETWRPRTTWPTRTVPSTWATRSSRARRAPPPRPAGASSPRPSATAGRSSRWCWASPTRATRPRPPRTSTTCITCSSGASGRGRPARS